MPRERKTVGEVRDLGIRLIAALARSCDELRTYDLDIRCVEHRRDQTVSEDRPARVQRATERAQTEECPVLGCVDPDDAPAACRRTMERFAGVAPRSPLGGREE